MQAVVERRFVVCDPIMCMGCQICEVACSTTKEKKLDQSYSRIRVLNLEPRASIAIACLMCEQPSCVRSCPRKALRQDEETRTILIDTSKCTGCGWCVEACEFGAAFMHPTRKAPMFCDLCEGDPVCIKFCPFEGALQFTTMEDVAHKARKQAMKKLVKELAGA